MAYDGEPTIDNIIPPTAFVEDISPESQNEHTAHDSEEVVEETEEGEDVSN